jgi:serine/threonine-protein kinase
MPELQARLQSALGTAYRVERELAAGGMSVVFLANEVALGRKVVVKVLRPELSAGLSTERFRREIQLVAPLQHPHIVPVFAAGEAEGLVYYTMPFIAGESLRARLRRDYPLSIPDAVQILREILDALDHAHAHGIVHRDIKPENVLLSGTHVLVADFGVAKAVTAAAVDTTLTGTGFALGTPAYMAPEQAVGDPHTDHRADIYAAGVLAYEMLAGRPPFHGSPPQALVAAHITQAPKPLSRQRPDIPPALEAAVIRCLAKQPGERWQSAAKLRGALEGMMLTPVSGTTIVSGPVADEGRAAQRRSGWRWLLPIALAGAAVIYGALAWSRGLIGDRSLVAQGKLATREPIVVADFANRTGDSSLGQTIASALRVDLAQSRVVGVAGSDRVREALARMGRPRDTSLSDELAEELASREGIRAVLAGEVAHLGSGYALTARIVAPAAGQELASFRETAADSTQLIAALGRLSRKIRQRIGESVGAIQATPPLERVTTTSLPALRKYTRAFRLIGAQSGTEEEVQQGVELLEEAVALDTGFAMAYRKLGLTLRYIGGPRDRVVDALDRAMRHRDRLTELERHLTTATYYDVVDDNPAMHVAALRAATEADPESWAAWHNLSMAWMDERKSAEAASAARRAFSLAPDLRASYLHLIGILLRTGRVEEAAGVVDSLRTHFGGYDDAEVWSMTARLRFAEGESLAKQRLEAAAGDWDRVRPMKVWLLELAAVRGGVAEANRIAEGFVKELIQHDDSIGAIYWTTSMAQLDVRLRNDRQGALRRLAAIAQWYRLDRQSPADEAYEWLTEAYAVAGATRKARSMLGGIQRGRDARSVHRFGDQLISAYIARYERRYDSALSALRVADLRACKGCRKEPELARVFDLAGMHDSAIAYYRKYLDDPAERIVDNDARFAADIPEAYEALGRLYDEQGDRRHALDFYGRFVDLWRSADAELQPRVRAALDRITVLSAEPRMN